MFFLIPHVKYFKYVFNTWLTIKFIIACLGADSSSSDSSPDQDPSDFEDGESSTSGEFLWQAGGDSPGGGGESEDSQSGEEDFTPSCWDKTKTPLRSLLKVGTGTSV